MDPIAGVAEANAKAVLPAILTVALLTCLAACATSPIPLGLPCTVGPVVLDQGASKRLTRSEKEQIVVINESGEKLCRWKAPN